MNEIWHPLLLSLEIALAATALMALLAIPLAYFLSKRRFVGQGILETLILLPLVLPPTVVGYLLLTLFARNGTVGRFWQPLVDYSIVFRLEGAILAAGVVALPMLYMPAKSSFQNVDRDLLDISRTMGANRFQVFWHVSLPMARRGLLSGLILAFARALGEFGATIMVFGWQPRRLTLPISIYSAYESGDMNAAWPAVLMLLGTSLGLIVGYNHLAGKPGE